MQAYLRCRVVENGERGQAFSVCTVRIGLLKVFQADVVGTGQDRYTRSSMIMDKESPNIIR
jgi:hypothetical protein